MVNLLRADKHPVLYGKWVSQEHKIQSNYVQFNSTSTGGSNESDSFQDAHDQANEACNGNAPRDGSQAREEAKEAKPQGRRCGVSDEIVLLSFFNASQAQCG
jgi:hypothetical protein